VKALDLHQHIGRKVEIDYNIPWDDYDYTDRGRLNSVELETEPNDPRYPFLYVQIGDNGAIGFRPNDDVTVRFLDAPTARKEILG